MSATGIDITPMLPDLILLEAARLFSECWRRNQADRAAKIYWKRCNSKLESTEE
ncbi:MULTISPECIES: hypothetical protein [unclassified Microcoleus]|uniref:hypothetical protein n=1 Tax=unclassified Microcoleus TaxID=2642155 RepID=UPI002FD6BE79